MDELLTEWMVNLWYISDVDITVGVNNSQNY